MTIPTIQGIGEMDGQSGLAQKNYDHKQEWEVQQGASPAGIRGGVERIADVGVGATATG